MLKPIKNDDQYENALARVHSLMQKSIRPGSATSDELEVLTILIKEYETTMQKLRFSTQRNENSGAERNIKLTGVPSGN